PPRIKEVEPPPAPGAARPPPMGAAAQHDRLLWFPPRPLLWVEPHPDRAAAEPVARIDLDRQSEHRRDPERVDCAHRLHPARPVDQHAVPARRRRERIRHKRATASVDVDEVLARENTKCLLPVDPESGRCRARPFRTGRTGGRELAEDPEIELAL